MCKKQRPKQIHKPFFSQFQFLLLLLLTLASFNPHFETLAASAMAHFSWIRHYVAAISIHNSQVSSKPVRSVSAFSCTVAINAVFFFFFFCGCNQVHARRLSGGGRGMDRALLLACVICGILFSVLGLASFFILWAVNWRPWRIYRYLVEILRFCLPVLTWCFGFVCSFKIKLPCCNVNAVDFLWRILFLLLKLVAVLK